MLISFLATVGIVYVHYSSDVSLASVYSFSFVPDLISWAEMNGNVQALSEM